MLHEMIKKVRLSEGDSQAHMGEKLGVAQRTIAGWESGARQPNAEMIVKIAEAYNVSTDYLLGRTDESPEKPLVPRPTVIAARPTEGMPPVSQEEMEDIIRQAYELILKNKEAKKK